MRLKYEHRIYNKDFTSKAEFEEWLNQKKDKLEDIRTKVIRCSGSNWEMIDNNQLATNLDATLEDIIHDLDVAISYIKDHRSRLKE